MFKKVEIINPERHGELKFTKVAGYAVAAKTAVAPLGGSEIAEAAKYYPILFPVVAEGAKNEDAPLPVALFSTKSDENPFVAADGTWADAYIPAHIRRYPFIFAAHAEAGKFALALDVEAPHFKGDAGEPLFDEDKKATAVVEQAKTFLGNFQNDLMATTALVKELDKYGVLVAQQLNLAAGEKKRALAGFRLVDMKKVNELDDATLALWVRNGIMGIIYAHLNSISNLKRIVAIQDLD